MDYLSTALSLGGFIQSQNHHNSEIEKNNELTEKDNSKDEWGLYPEQEDGTGPQPPGEEEGEEKTNKTPEQEKAMTMWYFYTDWCPYCKKAKPQWDLLKSMYPDLTSKENGYGINFEEVNGQTQLQYFQDEIELHNMDNPYVQFPL